MVKKDGNEIVGKLTKLDVDKKTFTIETEDGKKHDLTIGDDTEFLGPRGGKSDKGIKDDRFVVGHEIKVTTSGNGKVVEEIRLPYRKDK